MSWRNIWRNPRRTIIILIAIIIGVWNIIFLSALMRGMEKGMIKNGISTLTGNIQIHHKDYRSDPAIENSITDPKEVETVLEKILPNGSYWTTRVRVNAIASNARHSDGVTLVGIDPEREAQVSFIGQAVTQGLYLKLEDMHGIVVGKSLMKKFETKIGHKLVLMSQATDGEIISRAFRIIGIFRAEMEGTEKQFAFISMPAAQEMLKLNRGISEISIVLPDQQDDLQITKALKSALPSENYDIDTWRNLLPMLNAYLKLSNGFIYIWYVVVFIAMGFGIVNTTLMAVFERMREFGLLKALGMKPMWIVREVLFESFLLLLTGMAIGNLLGFISVLVLSKTGIDLSAMAAGTEFWGMSRFLYPAIYTKDIVIANLVVFVLGLMVSLYPAAKAARFTPVEALVHN